MLNGNKNNPFQFQFQVKLYVIHSLTDFQRISECRRRAKRYQQVAAENDRIVFQDENQYDLVIID